MFLTTPELKQHIECLQDSLQRLQKHEPNWKRAERARGLRTIARVRQQLQELEADLAMTKGKK